MFVCCLYAPKFSWRGPRKECYFKEVEWSEPYFLLGFHEFESCFLLWCLMINVFLLSIKVFLSHESRSIAILDHFQSWKSLQRTGWRMEGNKSSFIHSLLPLRSAASKQADISPLALLLPSSFPFVFNFAFFKKKIIVPFYVPYIECNVWWILPFNECSQRRS